MPDPLNFDAAAEQVTQDDRIALDTPQGADPYDQAADMVASEQQVRLATSVKVGGKANPDTRARAIALADQTRLPVDVVERNIDTVARKVRDSSVDLEQLTKNHPAVAEWLSDPDNAAVSNDDVGGMVRIDAAVRALTGEDPSGILPPGYLFSGGKIIRPLGDGSLADQWDTIDDLAKDLERKGDRDLAVEVQRKMNAEAFDQEWGWAGNLIAGAGQSLQSTQRAIGTRTEYDRQGDEVIDASMVNAPGWFGDVQRGVGGLIADVPLMLLGGPVAEGAVALARLSRARAAVSGVVGRTAAKRLGKAGQVAAAVQPLAIREGITEGQEQGAIDGALAWMVETVVPGAFGRTGVERAILGTGGKPIADGWRGALSRLITDAGLEASEEAVTEFAHAVRERATGADPHALDPDNLWRRLSVAATVGGVAGGGFSLPGTVAEKFARDGEEAQRATAHADKLTNAIEVLAASKTNARAADRVLDQMEKSLGQSDRFAFVDAEDFRAAYDDPAAAAAALGVSREYAEALATGGQVQIPTAKLLQRAAVDESTAKLVPKVRRSPVSRNAAEAAKFVDSAPDEVKRLESQARASAEAVKAAGANPNAELQGMIEERLLSAGQEATTARTNATVMARTFAALGKRAGKDPAELYRTYLDGRIMKVLPKLMRGERFDLIDSMLDRIRSGEVPSDRDINGPSLVDFLREKGLRDLAFNGELSQLKESDSNRLPGERSLIRDDGITLDEAAQLATEAGYLAKRDIPALLRSLDDEVRGGKPAYIEGNGDPNAKAIRDSLDQMERALREAGVDVFGATNKQAREALAKLMEQEEGEQSLEQGSAVVAPRSGRLDLDALLRQWRKATGDRTPVGGDAAFQALAEEADAVDAAKGKQYNQPAYHGTPHRFDKFTTDHMGTGEGVQAYGWGLYFAGEKQVAEWYREKLSAMAEPTIGGKSLSEAATAAGLSDRSFDYVLNALRATGNDAQKAASKLNWWARDNFMDRRTLTAAAEFMENAKIDPERGRLYTVEIPDDGELLSWDGRLDAQPQKVRDLVDRHIRDLPSQSTGSEIYRDLGEIAQTMTEYRGLPRDEAASRYLLSQGIPGLRFLDGNSRGQGEGSYNYVIFDGADAAIREYEQPKGKGSGPRGSLVFGKGRNFTIRLFQSENLSTFLHEGGHLFLEVMGDLATAEGAAPDLVADYAALRSWFGKNAADIRSQAIDLATDNGAKADVLYKLRAASDEDIAKVAEAFRSSPKDGTAAGYLHEAMHEYFARGFEAYLMEGKAPVPSLRSVFARIKGWMVAIYKTVKTLRVQLSPEMVDVFDRLVAIEDEVDAAESRAGTTDILPPELFADPADFDEYRLAVQANQSAARDRLARELIGDYRKELEAAWREQRAEIRADVAREVDDRPVFQIISALQRGQLPDGSRLPDEYQGMKLDKGELVQEWGETVLKKLPGPANVSDNAANRGAFVYAEDGLSIEMVAKAWGFPDASTMIEAMIAAPDRDSLIDTTVAAKMRELHPDPLVDGSLVDRADRAIATDLRGELLAREMRALGSRTGQVPAPVEVLRHVARETISQQKARDLTPDKYRVAATTSARRATEAAGKQDWSTAYIEKQREALNLEMFRAARDAKEAGEKGRAYLRTFDTLSGRQRVGKAGGGEFVVYDASGEVLDAFRSVEDAQALVEQGTGRTYTKTNGYLEQIDQILEGFSLRRPSNRSLRKRESLRKWIERKQKEGEPVDIDPQVVDDLGNRNWNDLTVAEQGAAVDAVRNIAHIVQLKNRLMRDAKAKTFEESRGKIVENIVRHQPVSRPDQITDDLPHKITDAIKWFFNAHRKDSFLAHKMDGYQHGGIVWDYFIRPRNEAATEQETRNAKAAMEFSALFKEWGKSPGAIAKSIPGTNLKLTLQERIGLALNWGNAEGRQRVLMYLNRHGKTANDAQAVLDSLDAADWRLVNGMLRQINAFWSDIAALERRVTGLAPEKVQAVPFVTKAGVQPGGYYPIKYNARKSNKAGDLQAATEAKEQAAAAGGRAQTRRGHTKIRADNVEGLALRLDFGVAGEHIAEVIHDLTHREMLIDQNKLLRDKSISLTIKDHHGRNALDQLVNTAADIAIGDKPGRAAAERLLRFLRINGSAATFGFNLTSALINVTGFSQSLTRVGPGRVLNAAIRVTQDAAHLEASTAWVEEKSGFMKNRANTFIREVADAARRIEPGGGLANVRRWGYFPMVQVQRAVDTITWMAAYDKALADEAKAGSTIEEAEPRAVAIADQVVIDTQGSGRVGDLAAIQRGGEVAKLLTAFYSYFAVSANLQGAAIGRLWNDPKDPKNWLRLGTTTLLVWTLPAVLGGLVRSFLQGDERDEEEMWENLVREQAGFGAGMLVGIREASGQIEGGWSYSGPAGARGLGNFAKLGGQVADLETDEGMLKAAINFGGTLTGLPSTQANRLLDAVMQFEEDGDTWAATRRALFGAPRK